MTNDRLRKTAVHTMIDNVQDDWNKETVILIYRKNGYRTGSV